MSMLIYFCFQNVNAQRLEVHAIKDLSTDENAHKAWGVGCTVELDQWVKSTSFKVTFDWGIYKDKNLDIHPNFQRMGGSIAACYNINFREKFTFQFGGEISYIHLKYSYIYDYDQIDSLLSKPLTLIQTGGFIGIAPYIGVQYKLTSQFNVTLNVVPTYMIPVHSKSSVFAMPPEYKKGIWLFPIRLGISYQLFKNK